MRINWRCCSHFQVTVQYHKIEPSSRVQCEGRTGFCSWRMWMRTGAAAGDRQVHGSVATRAGGSDAERERGVGGRRREQSQRSALARLGLPPARPLRVHLRAQQRLLAPVIQSLRSLTAHRSLFADRYSLLTGHRCFWLSFLSRSRTGQCAPALH